MVKNSTAHVRTRTPSRRAILIITALALLIVAALVGRQRTLQNEIGRSTATFPDPVVVENDTETSTLAELTKALENEVRARRALADRIKILEARTDPSERAPNGGIESGSTDDELDSDETQNAHGKGASRFDDEVLFTLGVSPRDAARLRDQWVSHELDRAALLDRSIREGWFLSDRRPIEIHQLDQEFRATLSDGEFDRVLYALGKPNRVRIGEVLEGSSASEIGLRRGDILLSYDGQRLFKPIELLINSSAGLEGESVPIDFLRDGVQQTVYTRRGPLGVLTEAEQGVPLPE